MYNDVVARESVSTPDQVNKTISAWELSDNLGACGPDGKARSWHVGARYSYSDPYQSIMDRGALKVRIYPATDSGLTDGVPVLLSALVNLSRTATVAYPVLVGRYGFGKAAGALIAASKEAVRGHNDMNGVLTGDKLQT